MHATTQLGTVRPDRHLNSTHFSEGRGNRRRVVDCFNHGRALASTVLNPHRVHFRMFGNLPLSATDMPLKGTRRPTSFRAERVTLEARASEGCQQLPISALRGQAGTSTEHTFPRDKATGETLWLRQTRPHLGINHDEPPMVHFRMIGNLPLRAKDMPVEASPSATTFRAERSHWMPRHVRGMAATTHCDARPAPRPRDEGIKIFDLDLEEQAKNLLHAKCVMVPDKLTTRCPHFPLDQPEPGHVRPGFGMDYF
ncbi:hypothetical protein Lal_00045047 [Lupinus albus]|nr:hypothetical protein Lal_00045047 [Lupinus albus]